MNMNGKIMSLTAISVLLLFFAGFLSCKHDHTNNPADQAGSSDQKIVYRCPMHPSYTADKSGNCPICGMTLVPADKSDGTNSDQQDAGDTRVSVKIGADKQQQIGVKTALITKGKVEVLIRAVGRVAFDPDLLVAEREFIDAGKLGDKQIVRAAKQRLEIMGLGKEQIAEIARRGRPDENLTLPKDKAWIYATVYEREIPQVKAGGMAKIELPDGTAVGDGTIRAVDSVVDPVTRSARARIEIGNSSGTLRPNMFVNALIKVDLGEKLLVPRSAVVDSGKRKLVFVVHQGDHFSPTEVKLGSEAENSYVVESGLVEGDVVATNALFLIDSESQLKASIGKAAGHKHD